ncbi:MAG: beta-galactosidase [Bacteroidetes bacterium]|nr:beta-galactosidase [Bacteroidota bacterium]
MKPKLILLSACLILLSLPAIAQPHTFKIGEGEFLLDGKPFQIISGEMHFARIPRECWRDRLHMAKAMGLNTVATYVFWNFHETEKGKYNFKDNADVAEFCRLARQEGLWVIIRPSPYACAEWEFGGYPWWLLREKDLKVRSQDPKFMEMSKKYFTALSKQIVPQQITHGGPVIMLQIENEYGSYDKDKVYLGKYRDIYREAGIDVDLYTCDGPSQMPAGYLPGVLPAVNGLDNVKEVKELINKYNNNHGPYFIAEWYPAWFDSWGSKHQVVPYQDFIRTYDSVLAAGLSINIYMAHGGTTRWFWNGANMSRKEPYMPQTSSYDYDAPIDEAGNATPKYLAMREVIMKHLPKEVVLPPVPEKKKAIAVKEFGLSQSSPLFENLPTPIAVSNPLSFEDFGQGYGYMLYRTNVKGPAKGLLKITQMRDYALVFLDGKRIAVLDRRLRQDSLELDVPEGGARLDILLENNGRINYGYYLNDNKQGITGKVTFKGKDLKSWKMYGFPMRNVNNLKFTSHKTTDGPVYRKGVFIVNDPGDTYADLRNWGKGHVWINGRSIGKYWNIGPQQTLYVPAQWLKKGENEIVIIEQLKTEQEKIQFLDHPVLDQLQP